jgi:hypothetical protein
MARNHVGMCLSSRSEMRDYGYANWSNRVRASTHPSQLNKYLVWIGFRFPLLHLLLLSLLFPRKQLIIKWSHS